MMRAGKNRKPRRIQEALDLQKEENSFTKVARQLDVSYQLVWKTAHGMGNNDRVLRRFLALGVSPVDLDLPEYLQRELGILKRKVA